MPAPPDPDRLIVISGEEFEVFPPVAPSDVVAVHERSGRSTRPTPIRAIPDPHDRLGTTSARSSRTLRRRLRTVPAVVVGLAIAAPAMVVALPVLAVIDLVRGRPSLPRPRLAVFVLWYLAWEVVAVVASSALWVRAGFGRRLTSPEIIAEHERLQERWVSSLLAAGRRLLAIRFEIDGTRCLDAPGAVVMLCRHTSMADTLVPAKLLFDHGRTVRYVLKDELLWDPALDIIGKRLPNHFVDRSNPEPGAESAAIEALAAGAGDRDALVLFPEGTRWSPEKRERALERLRATDPIRARRAERLEATMPPHASGVVALLAGRPDADVVIMAHTGLEGLAGPADALRLLPLRHAVRVTLRRIPRSEVPTDPERQRAWLLDRWDEVDRWVVANRATGRSGRRH